MTLTIDGTSYSHNDNISILPGARGFVCGSANARPAASLSIDFDGTNVIADNASATSDGGLEDSFITIADYVLSGPDDCGLIVTCTASNSATIALGETPPFFRVTLNVISKCKCEYVLYILTIIQSSRLINSCTYNQCS